MADEKQLPNKSDATMEPDPYHLVVVGERRIRTIVCSTRNEIAKYIQEYRGNREITEILLFQGKQLEISVEHTTDIILLDGDVDVGRGRTTSEVERIEPA